MRLVLGCIASAILLNPALPVRAQKAQPEAHELVIVPKNDGKEPADYRFRLGEKFGVRASGSAATKIRSAYATGAGAKTLALHLDGVRMQHLPVNLAQSSAEGDLLLLVQLARDSSNDENRKAWDTLFKNQTGYSFSPLVALAIGNDPPATVGSRQPLELYVVRTSDLAWTACGGLAILLVVYFLFTRSPTMLRDAENGSYSLGKSQMAFWGLLVVLTFLVVLVLTGSMERIPPQVLILLGLSGATGLGAVLIGESKKAGKAAQIAALEAEKQRLESERLANPTAFPPTSQARLAQIDAELAELRRQLQPSSSKGFWLDICSDSNGPSFHRLQVVIWTLVLGTTFVWTVTETISMPEFSETLLILMGISSGTYLGFKLPEKT